MNTTRILAVLALSTTAAAQAVCSQPTWPGYEITTYATIADPIQLAFAGDGALYVARDASGSGGMNTDAVRIHRVAPGGGAAVEFGPSVSDPDGVIVAATATSSWDAGDVLVGGQVVLTPPIQGQILALDPTSGAPATVLAASPSHADPHHFAFDSSGRLLIADRVGQRVLAWLPPSPPSTLLTFAAAQPTYITVDASDHVYVSDDSGVIDEYDELGSFVRNITTVAPANAPAAIAVSSGGVWGSALYTVAGERIVRVRLATLERGELGCGFDGRTRDLRFGPDGALYVSRFDEDRVLRIAPPQCTATSPNVPGFEVSTYASLDGPVQLDFASDGTLWVGRDIQGTGGATNTTPVAIYRVGPGGSPAGPFGAAISDPDAVTVARTSTASWSAGDVLVGGQAIVSPPIQGQVVALDPVSAAQSTVFSSSTSYPDPHCFAWDSTGRLLIADRLGQAVLSSTGDTPMALFTLPNKVQFIAVDASDAVYSSDSEGFLYHHDALGAGGLFAGRLDGLAPIAVSPGGAWGSGLYVVSDGLLLRYDTSGDESVIGCGFTDTTSALAFGPDGALYASRADDDVVLRIRPILASYCTAGTTTNGCTAHIAGSGVPSATAAAGFVIDVSGVEGQKQGFVFYGASGRAAFAWGGGTSVLCVKTPTQRLGARGSGGTAGACDGLLTVDWNEWRTAHPVAVGAPFSAGQVLDAQGWFRDPPAPKTSSLSDALEFVVQP